MDITQTFAAAIVYTGAGVRYQDNYRTRDRAEARLVHYAPGAEVVDIEPVCFHGATAGRCRVGRRAGYRINPAPLFTSSGFRATGDRIHEPAVPFCAHHPEYTPAG